MPFHATKLYYPKFQSVSWDVLAVVTSVVQIFDVNLKNVSVLLIYFLSTDSICQFVQVKIKEKNDISFL